ncbi:Transcription-repair-coupling factor [bioreactor metagenome]|uniref:Transcription-repair-coupling factor n=1 Tax=bioreactor metagenome TaxID=1076179 RepID=A0A645IXF4_9ZZZZ
MLPDSYVSSIEERLSLYQKLAEIQSKEELKKLESELVDRFGTLPKEALNLLKSVELKWIAAEIGFEKIVVKNGIFLGYFPSNPQDKFYQSDKFKHIISYLSMNPKEATLKGKHSAEGNQLMMRKEDVRNVDEVTGVLERILYQ